MNFEDIKENSRFYSVKNNNVRLLVAESKVFLNRSYLWKCSYNTIIDKFDKIFDNDYDAYLYLADEIDSDYKALQRKIKEIETGKTQINRV